ncbi:MAG TPA: hypothetical protein VKB53_02810 [Gammaproteobacteria bacterium]|nr:hypothetical protein [Gammaproteobacteria bacterium]
MTSNSEFRSSHLLVGLGLAAIGGLVAALLARRDTRNVLRESGANGLDYLDRQAGKLRRAGDVIVQQARKLLACRGSRPVISFTEADTQAYRQDKVENLGG